jgi:hypothetical protein
MFITSLIYEQRHFSRVLLLYTDSPLTQPQVLRTTVPYKDWSDVKRKLKISKALVLLHVNVGFIFLANISHLSATLNMWYSKLSRRFLSPQCAVFLTNISKWTLLHILQISFTFQLEASTHLKITLVTASTSPSMGHCPLLVRFPYTFNCHVPSSCLLYCSI